LFFSDLYDSPPPRFLPSFWEGVRMLQLASGLVWLPLALANCSDLETPDDHLTACSYQLCVPWAPAANPRSWDEVVGYYSEPPFALPAALDLLPPLPGEVRHPAAADHGLAAGKGNGEWESAMRSPRKVKQKSEGDWGSLSSQMLIQEGQPTINWEDPLRKRQWQTEGAWKYGVVGPFSLYGQVNAGTEETQQQDMKFAGKTGLACSVPTGIPQAALTLRSGPAVTYTDALRPDRVRERAEWVLEVEARWPLLAGIGLEYQGTALPALNPLDRDRVSQDLRLAFPMGSGGKFKLGAKRQWENAADARVVNDSMQLYLGLELTR
jgi:hypothetical protein